jgi:hypothetical protein
MGMTTIKDDIHVRVDPRSASDLGFASIGGITRPDAETIQMCEGIAADIRRHVDGLPSGWVDRSRGVQVVWTDVQVCEFCGSKWDDRDAPVNGCCAQDEGAA